jgi:hypothetical protein
MSENGMYIKMDRGLYYYKSLFNIHVLLANGTLDVSVKISRFVQADGFYYAMGVELLDPPGGYLDFINNFRSSKNSSPRDYSL